jgi:hypothetical protein
MTLFRHAHLLHDGETSVDRVGRTFRVRPADGESTDDRLAFRLWSTLDVSTRPTPTDPPKDDPKVAKVDPKVEPKPQPTVRPTLILETSADGERWVTVLAHQAGEPVQLAPVELLLPFVRVRVAAQGFGLAASATLLANAPIALEHVRPKGPVVVVRSA